MDNSAILPWLSLKHIPGIGNHIFKKLIDAFKSPENVFSASLDDLTAVEGISQRLASEIRKWKPGDTIKKELDSALEKGYKIITMNAPAYPALLLQIPDPPPYLYVYGDISCISSAIAVVGSRNATDYGISTTKRLCMDLASMNFTVVSGMAVGIDTAAHQGALAAKGKTIAVLGSGLEKIYPKENTKLFHEIAGHGAVVSEFSINAGPDAHHFPARNRIISGMSLGTVVVEATKRSGSLITARMAADQGRDVFAVPGSIQSFKSTGTHSLLKQGAKLVENARDIIEELTPFITSCDSHHEEKNPVNCMTDTLSRLKPDEAVVVNALEPYPIHIDDITRKTSIESGKLSGILLKLELMGIIQQSPGKLFSISEVRS